ncbi:MULTISPECIES: SpoIVB peptidase [Bacillaceae]|uniref:SpoIVB peptidase n=1 Tax=Halalkalibacter alkaliphilus TaxID=2917993 RepID=A0A9X2CRP7_9BACI|nr:SpoIVB peptidase [Alkalihalobacillus sp. MEB130]MCL7746670.1 SpoIVB peptidase [Halalkalibacter alkaliphilus]MDT8860502.1 SpoIVB peptidase [Alkalihalobacillus sp. MEB130]
MKGEGIRKLIGCILLLSIFFVGYSTPVQDVISIPNEITVYEGQQISWEVSSTRIGDFSTKTENEKLVTNITTSTNNRTGTTSITATSKEANDTTLTIEIGNFPIKQVQVRTLPELKILPGGQSIGVKLNKEGVVVAGYHSVKSSVGEESPAVKAGIEVGDLITKINGNPISRADQVEEIVQEAGEKKEILKIEIRRDNQFFLKELTPLRNKEDDKYQSGLYIRDFTAGIGTLTFFHPDTNKYGALGHVISEAGTKQATVVHDGQIMLSPVTSIKKGVNGEPGEKIAKFLPNQELLGSVTLNSPFGLFGEVFNKDTFFDQPIPVASADQIKEGPAKILTVIEGDKVQEFDIEILKSNPRKSPTTKGLIIKVTDPKLLETTGGIVQGMSGSPIIQEGKLIGAVTHVFVNDPTSGYGGHIEWMLQEAGVK